MPSPSQARAPNARAWVGLGRPRQLGAGRRGLRRRRSGTSASLLLDADAEELKDTRNAQLTTFVASLMVLDAVERLGIEPHFCAGHSLGEYTALTATGALAFEEGVRLVCERAEAMHDAGHDNPGTMAAVLGLDDDLVEVACNLADHDVWVANFNAPGQVVIAGSVEGVGAASTKAKELGAKKVMALPVSGAFHTPFMAPARDRLRKAIAEADPRDTEVPVVSNVDALPHDQGARVGQPAVGAAVQPGAVAPVPADLGPRRAWATFVELGPGGVLTGMAKRTVDGARTLSVATPDDLDRLLGFVADAKSTLAPVVEGEHLFATERLVVSPAAGVFSPVEGLAAGSPIATGQVLGHVGEHEVRSPFEGVLQAYIAVHGERVTNRQPIAWLRTA